MSSWICRGLRGGSWGTSTYLQGATSSVNHTASNIFLGFRTFLPVRRAL